MTPPQALELFVVFCAQCAAAVIVALVLAVTVVCLTVIARGVVSVWRGIWRAPD